MRWRIEAVNPNGHSYRIHAAGWLPAALSAFEVLHPALKRYGVAHPDSNRTRRERLRGRERAQRRKLLIADGFHVSPGGFQPDISP